MDAFLLYALLQAGLAPGTASALSLLAAALALRVLAGGGSLSLGKFAAAVVLTQVLRAGVLAWMERIPGCPMILTVAATAVAAAVPMRAAMRVAPAPEGASGDRPFSWREPVGALLLYAVLLRLVYLGLPELIHQEAYYWNYSRHLALSYLDHPPMVAWMIRGFTDLMGQTVPGVRAGTFFAWLLGACFVFGLTRRVYDRATARAAVLLFAALPVYFLAGFLTSPDMPMIACWAGSLYFFHRALVEEEPAAWLGAGVALGLGMLSKYTIVLLGFAVFAFMLADPRARRWFRRPHPWAAAATALVLFTPVIVWNARNHWMSFVFQGPRRVDGTAEFSLPALLGAAALMITPVGLAAVAVALCSRSRLAPAGAGRPDDRFTRGFRLLMASTLLPFAVFVSFSLFRHIKFNWTSPLWLGALPFLAHMMTTAWPEDAGRWRAWLSPRVWRWTTVAALLVLGFGMQYLTLGVPGLRYPANKLGFPARGWPVLGERIEAVVKAVERETRARPLVVGLNSDRLSSWLAFYRSRTGDGALDTAGPNLLGLPRSHMYEVWFPSLDAYPDRPLILVGDEPSQLEAAFDTRDVGPVREIVSEESGSVVWRIYYRVVGPERKPGTAVGG